MVLVGCERTYTTVWKELGMQTPVVWPTFPGLGRLYAQGRYAWEFLVGVCRLVLQILTRFQTKKCNFPYPFSDLNSKIHTLFQTWPLGRNYVIITQIRAQTKKFFKPISNSYISFFLSYLFGIETIKTFIQSRSSLKNRTRLQTKMGKVYTRFQTKTAQKPYLMGRGGTYHTREYPPAPMGLYVRRDLKIGITS